MAGAKHRSGGKRPGSGRKPGVPNKATAEIKALAQKHGADAIKRLAHLMTKAESEQAQVAACKELLDRAYGKPTQAIIGDDDEAPVKTVMEIIWGSPNADTERLHGRPPEITRHRPNSRA